MTIRVAFVGAGQMARHHLHAIERLGAPVAIVGVHDRAAEQARGLATLAGCSSFDTIASLIAESRPDVVHVCTPPATHVETARELLERGVHVYVEKPFAPTVDEARRLLDLASSRRRLVCAGHQLLHDPAFRSLMSRRSQLGDMVQADSHFAFRPLGAAARGSRQALVHQLVDILPHPLYSLVFALEQCAPTTQVALEWAHANSTDVQAILRAGALVGRLSVTLRGRPIASSLTLSGTAGSLSCDFIRTTVHGLANAGTEALEKIVNPMAEGAQLIGRTGMSLVNRLRSGASYPGLSELIGAFYRAIETGAPSPIAPGHLLSVADLFEQLVSQIHAAPRSSVAVSTRVDASAPLTVVTGANGLLGSAITRVLPRVRGIGRSPKPDDTAAQEWVTADLAGALPARALERAAVVIHAAAETNGGFEAHQRNSLDATTRLMRAMAAAGVSRMVFVSSLSVVRPPRAPWERQDEQTPRPIDPRALGAYTWGKCKQEALVEELGASLGIAVRIVRPGALVNWRDPELPGLVGRRLFGRWHLGFGRPSLPIAVCDVQRCAEVLAWSAANFDEAPPVVNLFEPATATRRELITAMRAAGWQGRMVWIPISVMAVGIMTARTIISLLHGRRPEPLAVWSILRPRRFSSRLSSHVLERARSTPAHSSPDTGVALSA